jgi:ABC-type enterobactin transport system permease subunit
MSVAAFLAVLFACAAGIAIVSAGQLEGSGLTWADQICSQSYGLCHQPFLLGLAVGAISSIYFLGILIRKKD